MVPIKRIWKFSFKFTGGGKTRLNSNIIDDYIIFCVKYESIVKIMSTLLTYIR